VRFWWNRFGPLIAAEIRRRRVNHMRGFRHWRWHLDEVYVKINGKTHYLWRAVDHEGEILESFVTKKRDKSAALKFLKKALKRHGQANKIVTDGLRSYPAAMRQVGNLDRREMGQWLNNRAENSHLPFRRRERAMLRFSFAGLRLGRCKRREIRFSSCLVSQPFQLGAPSRRSSDFQTSSLGCLGRVAVDCRLKMSVLALRTPIGDELRLD